MRLHFTLHDAEHLYIVTELASGGELFSHIRRLGTCHSVANLPLPLTLTLTLTLPLTRHVPPQLRALADGRAGQRA